VCLGARVDGFQNNERGYPPEDHHEEATMTTPSSPQGLPIAVPLVAALEDDDVNDERTGPTVGASDADADAAASGADGTIADATRDSDGVPVGSADVEEDKRASGA
jgi:hypothetical protein